MKLRPLHVLAGVLLAALTCGACAQSPAEREVAPTPHLTLPLAPAPNGSVIVNQSTTNTGGGNSVIVLGSTVQAQGAYSGSTPAGQPSGTDLALTLENALALGLRFNLGAISQSQAVLNAEGARRVVRSELLPNLKTEIGEQLERLNLRTQGVESATFPVSATFNYFDARIGRLEQTVLDITILNKVGCAASFRTRACSH